MTKSVPIQKKPNPYGLLKIQSLLVIGLTLLMSSCAKNDPNRSLNAEDIDKIGDPVADKKSPQPDVSPFESELPELFQQKRFNSASIAEAVNHYVSVGEDAALAEFEAITRPSLDVNNRLDINERIGWLCRILYEPIDKPLRPPSFGALRLSRDMMPLEKWPLYPIAKTGDTYCVLTSGYSLSGFPESVPDYLSYCQKNGRFRSAAVKIPTQESATSDIEKLRLSKRWAEIEFGTQDDAAPFKPSEEYCWKLIIRQANLEIGR